MNYALFEFLDVNKARKVLLGFLGGGVRAQSAPNPDPISNQNKSFSHRFHTWPLKSISVFRSTPLRNDIIITYTTTSKKKRFLKAISNSHISLSFILTGIETIHVNALIHSRTFLENCTQFQTKMDKVYTRFQTKTAKNHTVWGST